MNQQPTLSKDAKRLNAWCNKYPNMTRNQQAALLKVERRTFYRWIGGDTKPPGIVGLMLDVFKDHPHIEAALIERATLNSQPKQ